MTSKPSPRDTMLKQAQAHLEAAEQTVKGDMKPADADMALARVRIALASAWIELGREQTS